MSLDLEKYMMSRYVNGGRVWPNLDCWGMTRLAVKDVHGVTIPLLNGLDAGSLMGKSRNYVRLAKTAPECEPKHGAIAAVVTGKACEHVGMCIDLSGSIYVMETTEESGPRIVPLASFIKDRGNVRYYAPA